MRFAFHQNKSIASVLFRYSIFIGSVSGKSALCLSIARVTGSLTPTDSAANWRLQLSK